MNGSLKEGRPPMSADQIFSSQPEQKGKYRTQ